MQTGATRYGTQTAVEYQAPLTSDDIPFPLNEAKRRREGSTLKIRDSRLETRHSATWDSITESQSGRTGTSGAVLYRQTLRRLLSSQPLQQLVYIGTPNIGTSCTWHFGGENFQDKKKNENNILKLRTPLT